MTSSQQPESSVTKTFKVVVNHQEQFSIWPAEMPIPEKWTATGVAGSKEECLAYIRSVWTDMRPLSVKKRHRSRGMPGEDDEAV